jgi:dolichol-phosphate mannosyltransferase
MKTFAVIPTYNEAENIGDLIRRILGLGVNDLHVLVVDDNSPDGTGDIVNKLSERESRIALLTRYKKKGRGSAGIDGFKYAIRAGADYIIEMDGDFSHDPKYIPEFLKAIENCDVVLGSRFVKGGRDVGRGLKRRFITTLAGLYVRSLLKINTRDVSSGYRCFKRSVFEKIDLDNMVSGGPSIVLEILYKTVSHGFKVTEIPIVFTDRRQGKTKLDYITLLETLVMVLRLRKMKKDSLL